MKKLKFVIEIERKKINIELVCILWLFIFTAYDVAIVISTSHAIFRRLRLVMHWSYFSRWNIWVMYIRKFKYVLRNSAREPPSR